MNRLFWSKTARQAPAALLLLLLGWVLAHRPAAAYPPAPFHLFYGMLRDEYGTPINYAGAEVILETSAGVKISTKVIAGIEAFANYRMEIPMDSGLSGPTYQPTALRPMAPFRLKVRVGGAVYLPMEMAGDFRNLGHPGKRTRLNLTLGQDTDGDGLPDAWERLFNADLSMVNPDAPAGNGMNYLNSYYAGIFTGHPEDGFSLSVLRVNEGAPVLEFLAVTGRTYTIEGSSDLKTWQTMPFRLSTAGVNGLVRSRFSATSIETIQVEVVPQSADISAAYFRLMLE